MVDMRKKESEKQIVAEYNATVKDNPLQAVLSWIINSGSRLKPFKFVLNIFYIGKIPGLRNLIPWLNPKKNCIIYLPVNKSLESAGSSALPGMLVHQLIDEASVHVIMNECGCRLLEGCKNHPINIGCLFMGDTALRLPHGVSSRVTRAEAHAHVDKGIAAGMVPMSGKVRIDNFIYMTPDRGKLLSVCFCCPCCCILRSYKHLPGKYLDGIIEPVEGLSIEVTGACVGCGTCIKTCPFDAIVIQNGKSVHKDTCRKCGRCEANCPEKAVTIALTDEKYLESTRKKIKSYVQF